MNNKSNTCIFRRVTSVGVLCIALLGSVLFSGCTDRPTAERVLRQNGYTNIEITGYRWGMGGENDTYVTGFRAKSPSGQVVTGAVCNGFLKGATIRFD